MSHDPTRLGHRLRPLQERRPEILHRCRQRLEAHGELSCGAGLRVLVALMRELGETEERAAELDAQACAMALMQRQQLLGRGAPAKRSRWPQRLAPLRQAPRLSPAEAAPRLYLVHEARELLTRRAPLPREPEALKALVRSRLSPWGVDALDVEHVSAELLRRWPELFAPAP